MDLSVVIASYANPQGLYLTVFSLLSQLSKSNITWEIIIAADGGTDYKYQNILNVRVLRIRSGSPQGTRDVGIRAASGASVLVIEDHVVISDVKSLLEIHNALKGAITVPYRIGETSELFTSYGYEQDFDSNFWNKRTIYTPKSKEPYKILSFGHAAFMVDKKWYLDTGGYCLEIQGWGGEEPDLNLLVYQTGRETWMVPTVFHAHFLTPGAHTDVTLSDNFKRNFCIAAYEHGGDCYLLKAQQHFNYILRKNPAIEARRQRICQGKFKGDLDLLRKSLPQ